MKRRSRDGSDAKDLLLVKFQVRYQAEKIIIDHISEKEEKQCF